VVAGNDGSGTADGRVVVVDGASEGASTASTALIGAARDVGLVVVTSTTRARAHEPVPATIVPATTRAVMRRECTNPPFSGCPSAQPTAAA
jgi:hypothetical protein